MDSPCTCREPRKPVCAGGARILSASYPVGVLVSIVGLSCGGIIVDHVDDDDDGVVVDSDDGIVVVVLVVETE